MSILRSEATVRVRPGSSVNKIESFGNDRFLVKVTSTNHDDINNDLKEMFSHYFGVPASKILITAGFEENDKKIMIDK